MVDDVIGFAPSNHGTTQAAATCNDGSCSAADWQQWDISHFMQALNSYAETWPGISYTDVYTHTDEIVQPNADDHGSSSLHTGGGRIANVTAQDICPGDTNEHLLVGLIDPVAYALAVDALDHDGPADPKRVGPDVCAQQLQPGVNPATFPADSAAALADFEGYQATEVPAEPRLACYTTASCPPSSVPPAADAHATHAPLGAAAAPARPEGHAAATSPDRRGRRRTVTVDLGPTGAQPVVLVVTGAPGAGIASPCAGRIAAATSWTPAACRSGRTARTGRSGPRPRRSGRRARAAPPSRSKVAFLSDAGTP